MCEEVADLILVTIQQNALNMLNKSVVASDSRQKFLLKVNIVPEKAKKNPM